MNSFSPVNHGVVDMVAEDYPIVIPKDAIASEGWCSWPGEIVEFTGDRVWWLPSSEIMFSSFPPTILRFLTKVGLGD